MGDITQLPPRPIGKDRWKLPYSLNRLLNWLSRADFSSVTDNIGDEDDGEPSEYAAIRRLKEALQIPSYEPAAYRPLFFRKKWVAVRQGDLAVVLAMLLEHERWHEELISATGPQCIKMEFNEKTGKLEDGGLADDYGE
jgi:hypothetical protein